MYTIKEANPFYFAGGSSGKSIYVVEREDPVENTIQEQVFFEHKKDAYHFANFLIQDGVDVSVREIFVYKEVKKKVN